MCPSAGFYIYLDGSRLPYPRYKGWLLYWVWHSLKNKLSLVVLLVGGYAMSCYCSHMSHFRLSDNMLTGKMTYQVIDVELAIVG